MKVVSRFVSIFDLQSKLRTRPSIICRGAPCGSAWMLPVMACGLGALLAGESPASKPGHDAVFRAIRQNDVAGVRAWLDAGGSADPRDAEENTALHAAAISAGTPLIQALLEAGADPNAVNRHGATPLHRAAARPELTHLLLDAGADVNVRSALGNTPLMISARQRGASAIVRRMLEGGADPNATNVYGATPLMAASAAGEADSVIALLDHGADIDKAPLPGPNGFVFGGGRTPLMWAAYHGDEPLIRLLLDRGADVNAGSWVGSPLSHAAWSGEVSAARVLIEAGARVDSRDEVGDFTPLHWAASAERHDTTLTALLLERGADPLAVGGGPADGFLAEPQTPSLLASRRGQTPLLALLSADRNLEPLSQGKVGGRTMPDSLNAPVIAEAIARALPPLQRTAAESRGHFTRHVSKQNCISCHQQFLPMAAVGSARQLNLPIDEGAARQQIEWSLANPSFPPDFEAQPVFHPEPAIEIGYHLLGLAQEKQDATPTLDAMVFLVAAMQSADGSWAPNMPRPPLQDSRITATALGIYSLQTYPIPGRSAEFKERVARAGQWLVTAEPETTEERAYQLLGLVWGGHDGVTLASLTEALAREQRSDGGWSAHARSGLGSDAYATGLSLFALAQAGGRSLEDSVSQQAARFLLQTQADDGTWRVRRRAFPFQPPMASGYPYGADAWISAAGASWAVMGLAALLDPNELPNLGSTATAQTVTAPPSPSEVSEPKGTLPTPDFVGHIQPLFERSCLDCHAGEKPKGGFRLESRDSLLAGGNRGEPVVVPGKPEESVLLACVSDTIEDLEMPPLRRREAFPPLNPGEVELLRAWIAGGAPWPQDLHLKANARALAP